MFAPQVYSQKGGSESEPSVSARANEQASRACLFAKKEEQRHERVLIFCKKIGASDIKLAPTWRARHDSNRHGVATGGF